MSFLRSQKVAQIKNELDIILLTKKMVKHLAKDSLRWNNDNCHMLPDNFKSHEDIQTMLNSFNDLLRPLDEMYLYY